MSSTKVTLRHHKPKGDKVPPVVVTFPHGPPPPECFTGAANGAVGPNKLGALQVEYLANTQANRESQRVVAARNGKMKYRGTNFGRFSSNLSLSKYMVGVYNRDTKHVDMYDLDGVFALQQQPLRAASALSLKGSIDGGVTDWDRRKMLITTFGSRKKQNLQKSREAGMVDAGNVTAGTAVSRLLKKQAAGVKPAAGAGAGAGAGADADGAGAGAGAVAVDAVAAAQDASRRKMLPPVNMDATTLEGAYPVDGLVTREEQAALMPTVKEMLGTIKKPAQMAELRSSQAYGDYVLDHLESMPKDKKELRAAMRLVVYMDHLLRLFETPFVLRTQRGDSSFGESEESVPHLAGIPQIIQDRLLSTFCERQVNNRGRTSYVRTSFLRDKLLMHICALALTIDKYALDITGLAKDLKMQPKQLASYFRELGCTYKSKGPVKRKRGDDDGEAAASVSGYTVALRVPLKFPKVKKMRR